jgi:hypothetical protein
LHDLLCELDHTIWATAGDVDITALQKCVIERQVRVDQEYPPASSGLGCIHGFFKENDDV